jgi:hypothetical protein
METTGVVERDEKGKREKKIENARRKGKRLPPLTIPHRRDPKCGDRHHDITVHGWLSRSFFGRSIHSLPHAPHRRPALHAPHHGPTRIPTFHQGRAGQGRAQPHTHVSDPSLLMKKKIKLKNLGRMRTAAALLGLAS